MEQVSAAPRIYFEPATYSSSKNTDFQINLKIDVENKSTTGAKVTLNFPSDVVTFKDPASGGFFSDFSFSRSDGRIVINAQPALGDNKTGSGTLAILTLNSNKDTGTGAIIIACSDNGNDSFILDTMGTNILDCGSVNQLSLTYSSSNSGNSGNGPTNACGGTCGSVYNCNSGLFCYQGFCRNPDCRTDLTCSCKSPTPSPTIKPKTPTPTIKPSATPTVVTLTQFTPLPSSTPSATPVSMSSGSGLNLQKVALWTGLGILGLAILFAIIGMIKSRNKPPKITPPETTTTTNTIEATPTTPFNTPLEPPVMSPPPPTPPVEPPPPPAAF